MHGCYYACQLTTVRMYVRWQLLSVPSSCLAVPIWLWPKHMVYHTAMQSISDANNGLNFQGWVANAGSPYRLALSLSFHLLSRSRITLFTAAKMDEHTELEHGAGDVTSRECVTVWARNCRPATQVQCVWGSWPCHLARRDLRQGLVLFVQPTTVPSHGRCGRRASATKPEDGERLSARVRPGQRRRHAGLLRRTVVTGGAPDEAQPTQDMPPVLAHPFSPNVRRRHESYHWTLHNQRRCDFSHDWRYGNLLPVRSKTPLNCFQKRPC